MRLSDSMHIKLAVQPVSSNTNSLGKVAVIVVFKIYYNYAHNVSNSCALQVAILQKEGLIQQCLWRTFNKPWNPFIVSVLYDTILFV